MKNLRIARRNILSRDKADALLRDYYDDFKLSVQHGLNQVALVPAGVQAQLRSRTLANLLNDLIVKHAETQFADSQNVVIDNKHDGTFFIIKQQIALRFKKVDDHQSPRNYPTKRQVEIAWQYREFDGFPTLTVVNVGYLLNKVWSEIKSVSVSCRRGEHLEWEIPIGGDMSAFLFDRDGNAQRTKKALVRSTLVEKAKVDG